MSPSGPIPRLLLSLLVVSLSLPVAAEAWGTRAAPASPLQPTVSQAVGAAAPGPDGLPALALPAVGDWSVFRVREQTRDARLTLRVLSRGRNEIELSALTVCHGVWDERIVRLPVSRWSWERLPDLLVAALGRKPPLAREHFSLRSVPGSAEEADLSRQVGRRPGSASSAAGAGAAPAGGAERLRAAAVGSGSGGPRHFRLEVQWQGRDPSLGGIEMHRTAAIVLRPRAILGGIVQATIEEWLGLNAAPGLHEQIRIERLRSGGAASWSAEGARYRAR